MIGNARDPQPDPREQGRADVLGDPDGPESIGMQTLDQCLVEMVRRNMVNVAEARNRAVNKDLFM